MNGLVIFLAGVTVGVVGWQAWRERVEGDRWKRRAAVALQRMQDEDKGVTS